MPRTSHLNLTFENKIYSSMLLLIDYLLLKNGGYKQYTNIPFFEDAAGSEWADHTTYTCQYKQFAVDAGLGIAAPTFNHLSGTPASLFLNKGSILYAAGSYPYGGNSPQGYPGAYVNTPTATANVKDVNIYSASEADANIIFDSFDAEYFDQPYKGLPFSSQPYPGIWLKNNGGHDEPMAFGGQGSINRSYMNIRAICVSDNPYTLDVIISILKSLQGHACPIVADAYSLVGDIYGGWDGSAAWDFGVAADEKDAAYINNVKASRVNRSGTGKSANPNAIAGIIDFEMLYWRNFDRRLIGYDANEYGMGPLDFLANNTP